MDSSCAKLKVCKRCRIVYYCGTVCQRADWQDHKSSCCAPTPGEGVGTERSLSVPEDFSLILDNMHPGFAISNLILDNSSMDGRDETSNSSRLEDEAAVVADLEEGGAGIMNLHALGPWGRGPWCCFTACNGEEVPFAWFATAEEARQHLQELEVKVEEEWRLELARQAVDENRNGISHPTTDAAAASLPLSASPPRRLYFPS